MLKDQKVPQSKSDDSEPGMSFAESSPDMGAASADNITFFFRMSFAVSEPEKGAVSAVSGAAFGAVVSDILKSPIFVARPNREWTYAI